MARIGREAIQEGQEELEGPPGGPGGVRKAGRGRESLPEG